MLSNVFFDEHYFWNMLKCLHYLVNHLLDRGEFSIIGGSIWFSNSTLGTLALNEWRWTNLQTLHSFNPRSLTCLTSYNMKCLDISKADYLINHIKYNIFIFLCDNFLVNPKKYHLSYRNDDLLYSLYMQYEEKHGLFEYGEPLHFSNLKTLPD